MEIIAAVLGALIAVMIGAYIQHLFTWKIQNRVTAVDNIYLDVLKYNQAFLEFCVKHKDHQNLQQLDSKAQTILNDTIVSLNHNMNLNCFIIDGVKCGKLYNKIYLWSHEIEKNANNCVYDEITQSWNIPSPQSFYLINGAHKDEIAERYQTLLNDIQNTIFDLRGEITSFAYMFTCQAPILCTS